MVRVYRTPTSYVDISKGETWVRSAFTYLVRDKEGNTVAELHASDVFVIEKR